MNRAASYIIPLLAATLGEKGSAVLQDLMMYLGLIIQTQTQDNYFSCSCVLGIIAM